MTRNLELKLDYTISITIDDFEVESQLTLAQSLE